MPFDGKPKNNGDSPHPEGPGLSCIVVGGCANGAFLPHVRLGAQRIALKRPSYIKPLASAVQKIPEIANEEDEYIVHPIGLQDDGAAAPAVVGVAVVAGRSLTWAFKQLVAGYSQNIVNELRAAGLTPPGAKSRKS